ncbi:MAG: ATP-binding protein [Gammaproteobacteria bacterium]|nr:ATP-binding protein [Gammaproteobacteria bacterium]
MIKSILLAGALLCVATASAAQDAAAKAPSGDPPIRKLDGILVDTKGRGLYTYVNDKTLGKSDCNNQCRLLWPPLKAEPGAVPKGPFTLAVRDDGSKQWALRGKPLYRWASDKNYGDAGGDGVSEAWRLVRVAPPKPAASAPAPATAAATPVKPASN